MRVRFAPPVVFLLSRNHPMESMPERAWMLTAVSMNPGDPLPGKSATLAGWAWWEDGVWIGPRHTNFGDGSICSFELAHHTWRPGDPIVDALDLQSVWIARHLYLRHFGRWPGDQRLHTAHERVEEHRAGELCGCGSFKTYERCHRTQDLAMDPYGRQVEFILKTKGLERRPPPDVWAEFVSLARGAQEHALG